jgi:hypothetical protein
MVFYLIGLGLSSETDITVKGLEIVRRCSKVYLEHYTAILMVAADKLVRLIIIKIIIPTIVLKLATPTHRMADRVLRARGACCGPRAC